MQRELGLKWQPLPALELEAAAFRADSRHELAVAANVDGRASYRHVGSVRRQGYELGLSGRPVAGWQLSAGFTHLLAYYRDGFTICAAAPCVTPELRIHAGAVLPGVPRHYGSLRLQHGGDLGWRQGFGLQAVAATYADDAHTARAAGYALLGADLGYGWQLAGIDRLELSARVDNLADRHVVGSVIVNESNGRYFEPAPGRTLMLGARVVF